VALGAWALDVSAPVAASLIDEVVLFRSHLGSGGSRYEPLAAVTLQGMPA
jgi:2'-5' RNA ligase